MPFKLNVFTGTFDIVGDLTQGLADLRYLKLDQTTPQTVDNGAPLFKKGLVIAKDERIYFDG
jgi:hypothetical protein